MPVSSCLWPCVKEVHPAAEASIALVMFFFSLCSSVLRDASSWTFRGETPKRGEPSSFCSGNIADIGVPN